MKKFLNTAWVWFLQKLSRGSKPYQIIYDYQNVRTSNPNITGLLDDLYSRGRQVNLAANKLQYLVFSISRKKTKVVIHLDSVQRDNIDLSNLLQPCKHGTAIIPWLLECCQYPVSIFIYHSSVVTARGRRDLEYSLCVEFTMPRDAMMFKLAHSSDKGTTECMR